MPGLFLKLNAGRFHLGVQPFLFMFDRTLKQDVLVVGGGPAGLSAALAAAASGASVSLFEKNKEIGSPIRTSGGSWIAELQKLGIPEKFMHPIDSGLFLSPNESAEFHYEEPVSCVLDVRALYQYLAELAAQAGARIYSNCTVLGPLVQDNKLIGLRVRQLGSERQCYAGIVIDASGSSTLVGRKLGFASGFARFGIGAEYDLFAPAWPERKACFMFGSKVAPRGYAWILPHGKQRVRVGVGVIKPDSDCDPRDFIDRVCSQFPAELSGASIIEFHTGTIPSERYLEKTYADNLMIAGDAGGLVSVLLGEGIRFAIDIGRMAGRIAAEATVAGRTDAAFLRTYETAWKRKYKRIFQVGDFLNRRLAKYDDSAWDEKVRLLRDLAPEFLPPLLKGNLSFDLLFRMFRKNPHLFGQTARATLLSLFKSA